ncbi:glutamate receptor ionotropic, delta-2-like [Scylla paramamosain]|uniref:glutamate receptor ionotropic, delta-2-like n=1 Tax=Scylla paramamosain TaxID=85552 RepID=UPI003082CAB3
MVALFQYLVSQSNATVYYLLYDPSLLGSAGAVTTSSDNGGGLTLFRCSSSSSSLVAWLRGIQKALTQGYSPVTHKNVLVACSASHTSEIFTQVRQVGLESPSVHWYVVLQEEGATLDLFSGLREGTQVTVAARGKAGSYQVLSSYMDMRGETKFQEAGRWSWGDERGGSGGGGGRGGGKQKVAAPLTRLASQQYGNMGGRLLRAVVVENSPYFRLRKFPDGTLFPGDGIDVNLLNILANKLNFTYRLVEAADGQWGEVLPNGWVTGMIGVVARREADLAINEITVTGKRERVVDFSTPYFVEGTILVSPAPKEKNRAFAAFSPFSAQVWGTIVVVTLVMGPMVAAVGWLRQRCIGTSGLSTLSLNTLSFTAFRSLVVQGNLLFPNNVPLRVVFYFWYLFCFIIYAMYAGTLTAVLALPAFTKPIETLTDLLEAARRGDLQPAVVEGTSNAFLFKDAEGGIYKDIWEVFDPATGYAKNYDGGVDKVMNGPFVFVNARLGSEVRAAARGVQKFYISRDSFYPQSYATAFPTGSPIRVVVNPILTSITASGVIGKWMKEEVLKVTKSVEEEKNYAITLVHLQAAFFILLLGFLVATAALVAEKIYHRCTLYGLAMGMDGPALHFLRSGSLPPREGIM